MECALIGQAATVEAPTAYRARRPSYLLVRQLGRNRAVAVGSAIVILAGLVAVFEAQVAGRDPRVQDFTSFFVPPSRDYWFGTDGVGRDIYARVVYGTRYAFLIGVATIVIGAVPGVILGLVAGYFGRWWDASIMRLTDVMLAFPYFLSAIVVVALLGPSLENTIIAVGTYLIPSYVRLVRGSVLLIKRREYVEAARMIGSTDARIIGWHILPNTLSALIVHSTLSFPRSVIAASSLSFLGLGIQPPTPEWGAMVADSRNYLVLAPQAVFFPTLAIVVLSIAFNFMGEGMRDFLDPRMRRL